MLLKLPAEELMQSILEPIAQTFVYTKITHSVLCWFVEYLQFYYLIQAMRAYIV